MTWAPRPHQREGHDVMLRAPSGALCVVPTGGGKSDLMGMLAASLPGRTLIVAHVKELIDQNAAAAARHAGSDNVGIVAASAGRSNHFRRVTIAMVQTMANRLAGCGRIEPFDTILIDEAHRIPHGTEGQYHAVIRACQMLNPNVRVLGLTATPYRHPRGMLTEGPDQFFETIAYEVSMADLTAQGYLSPIVGVSGHAATIDLRDVGTVAGEYNLKGLGKAAMRVLTPSAEAIAKVMTERRSILVFASSVEHGEALTEMLALLLPGGAEFVSAETATAHRDRVKRAFASGELRTVVNMALWTTGFDVRRIDGIVLARATQSRVLYEQMLGRGTRLSPETGKENCLLLDLGGNVERFGGVGITDVESKGPPGGGDAPVIVCREDNTVDNEGGCLAFNACGVTRCKECGARFASDSKLAVNSIRGQIDLTLARTRGAWVPIQNATVTKGSRPKLTVIWEGGKATRPAGRSERTPEQVGNLIGRWALVRGDTLHGIALEPPDPDASRSRSRVVHNGVDIPAPQSSPAVVRLGIAPPVRNERISQ